MWKALLAAGLMLAAPLTALTATDRAPSLAILPGDDGVERSEDGRTVTVTDAALPASTGYVVATLRPSQDANATLEQEARTQPGGSEDRGFATLLDVSEDRAPFLHATMFGEQPADASVAGAASCCSHPAPAGLTFGTAGASASGDFSLHDGEAIRVGLLAQDWGPRDSFHASLTLDEGAWTIDDVDRGTEVAFVDLAEAAREDGTNAEVFGAPVAGDAGSASVEAPVEGTGLVALDSSVHEQARAEISLELPDGTTADNGDGRNVFLQVEGATGPGTVTATLENLEEPSLADQVEGTYGDVDAALVVADVDTPLSGLEVHRDTTTPPELPDDEHTVTVPTDEVPRPDGYVLATVTAPTDAVVDVYRNVSVDADQGEVAGHLPILATGDELRRTAPDVDERPPMLAVHAGDRSATCCQLPAEIGASVGSDVDRDRVHVGPERPLYVGAAVTGFDADDALDLRVRPNTTASGPVDLTLEEVHVGDTVRGVDLVRAAEANGTTASAFGQSAGQPGTGVAELTAEQAGLAAVAFTFHGEGASGQVTLELPDGTTHANENTTDVFGYATAATDPGTVRVTLEDLQRPNPAERVAGQDGFAAAHAILADLPLPVRGAHHDVH